MSCGPDNSVDDRYLQLCESGRVGSLDQAEGDGVETSGVVLRDNNACGGTRRGGADIVKAEGDSLVGFRIAFHRTLRGNTSDEKAHSFPLFAEPAA